MYCIVTFYAVMLSVIYAKCMLSVANKPIILSVIMLSVVAPLKMPVIVLGSLDTTTISRVSTQGAKASVSFVQCFLRFCDENAKKSLV
jgi:hypothetical protein